MGPFPHTLYTVHAAILLLHSPAPSAELHAEVIHTWPLRGPRDTPKGRINLRPFQSLFQSEKGIVVQVD